MKIIYATLLLLIGQYSYAQDLQEANSFTVKNSTETFIGSILKAENMNEKEHRALDVALNPIKISFSNAIKSKEITPSYNNMMQAIEDGLQENNVLKPNYSFSFSISELKSYDDLAILFGQKINPATFFGIATNQKLAKTIAVIDISQSYFSVNMDIPESLSDDPKVSASLDELIYVHSIEFGRRAIVIIESNSSYQEVKDAAQEMLKNASDKSSAILANSTIRCMTLGNDNTEEINPDNPLTSVINYMNKSVTVNDFGKPISFSAAHLKDHSVFVNKFSMK